MSLCSREASASTCQEFQRFWNRKNTLEAVEMPANGVDSGVSWNRGLPVEAAGSSRFQGKMEPKTAVDDVLQS